MLSVDDIKAFFKVREDQELAPIFGRTPGAISTWRKSGVPAGIERRTYEIMRERGIPIPLTVFASDSATASDRLDATVVRAGEPTPEQKEIMEIFKNYPLIKATMLKMAEMSEDDQFEYYKMIRDAEIAKRKGGKAAAHED